MEKTMEDYEERLANPADPLSLYAYMWFEEKEKKKKVRCAYCGTENPANANFCKKCGKKIKK
jgi:rRNA maturation endonuclease Nob1